MYQLASAGTKRRAPETPFLADVHATKVVAACASARRATPSVVAGADAEDGAGSESDNDAIVTFIKRVRLAVEPGELRLKRDLTDLTSAMRDGWLNGNVSSTRCIVVQLRTHSGLTAALQLEVFKFYPHTPPRVKLLSIVNSDGVQALPHTLALLPRASSDPIRSVAPSPVMTADSTLTHASAAASAATAHAVLMRSPTLPTMEYVSAAGGSDDMDMSMPPDSGDASMLLGDAVLQPATFHGTDASSVATEASRPDYSIPPLPPIPVFACGYDITHAYLSTDWNAVRTVLDVLTWLRTALDDAVIHAHGLLRP